MEPLEEQYLPLVSGGNTQRELLEFLERVERDLRRTYLEPVDSPWL
jgi:hypothetical protein